MSHHHQKPTVSISSFSAIVMCCSETFGSVQCVTCAGVHAERVGHLQVVHRADTRQQQVLTLACFIKGMTAERYSSSEVQENHNHRATQPVAVVTSINGTPASSSLLYDGLHLFVVPTHALGCILSRRVMSSCRVTFLPLMLMFSSVDEAVMARAWCRLYFFWRTSRSAAAAVMMSVARVFRQIVAEAFHFQKDGNAVRRTRDC